MALRRSSTIAAASMWIVTVLFMLATGALHVANSASSTLPQSFTGLGFTSVGAIVVARHPRNRIGWLFLLFGLASAIGSFSQQYALRAFITAPGSLPAATLIAWVGEWVVWFAFPGGVALLLLLFPDGYPPSRRWWPVAWFALLCIALMVLGSMFDPGEMSDPLHTAGANGVGYGVANPFGLSALGPLPLIFDTLGRFGAWLVLLVSGVGLLTRFIRARGDERQQLKWIAYAGAAILVFTVVMMASSQVQPGLQGPAFALVLVGIVVGIPAAAGVAILKYRLYDIDVVINRTLVYGGLAAFITAVYVGIVVGLGALVGTGGRPNLALSILATAIVAVAFQPVREWTQRLANRLVYGQRDTPYEVLAHFSEGVATTYSTDEVLPRMARIVAQGTGAAAASVWTARGDDLVPAATYPEGEPPVTAQAASRAVTVLYQGDQLGELRVRKRAGEAMTPVEDKLLRDLAGQAGLLLKNVSLTADLQARLGQISEQTQELRLSRRRIVAAQDAERRRLERNIHDGAQQHLVALAVKLKLTATLARRKPEKALPALDDLQSVTREALQTLTELAGGIYPSALREHGLKTALQSQAQRMTIPVTVDAPDLSRLPLEVEAAAYFACLEALQNVAKHARATTVSIRLEDHAGDLAFSVEDDGIGLPSQMKPGSGLQNMKDRLSALGGSLTIASHPGTGTVVSGLLPAGAGRFAPMNRAGSIGAVS